MSLRLQKKDFFGFFMMLAACVAYGAGTSLFLAPNVIIAGGVSGLCVTVHTLYEKIPIGILSIALNIPILLCSFKAFGWKFVLKSLVTIIILGVATDLFAMIDPITNDTLLATLYGGICQGIAVGLFVRYKYSSGGTELLGRLIAYKIKSLKIPVCLAVLDGIVVISGAIATRTPNNMLYALIVIFCATKISDIIITGLEKSKLCIIVTDNGKAISEELLKRSPRGITMWDGKGMYTETDHNVLLTCVKRRQLEQLKEIVKSVDPQAFIMVQDSVEVRGKGFSSLSDEIK